MLADECRHCEVVSLRGERGRTTYLQLVVLVVERDRRECVRRLRLCTHRSTLAKYVDEWCDAMRPGNGSLVLRMGLS